MTRIDELLAEIKRVRAEMQSRGLLSDPGRLDTRLMKLLDELAFIVKGQFKEINNLKRKVRKVIKVTDEKAKAKQTPEEKAEMTFPFPRCFGRILGRTRRQYLLTLLLWCFLRGLFGRFLGGLCLLLGSLLGLGFFICPTCKLRMPWIPRPGGKKQCPRCGDPLSVVGTKLCPISESVRAAEELERLLEEFESHSQDERLRATAAKCGSKLESKVMFID